RPSAAPVRSTSRPRQAIRTIRAIRTAPRPPPRTRRLRPRPARHRKAMASSSIIALARAFPRALACALAALGAVGSLGVLAPGAALALAHPPDQAAAPAAAPAAPDDEIPPPPPTFQAGGVTVDEHLGARVPLDARFRTQDGTPISLGEALGGGLPAILTFNYS